MKMTFNQFVERIGKSKSYTVTELFLSAVPSELYTNNAMNIPASAARDLYDACMGKFASDKDEDDYHRLMELIALNGPVYPLYPALKTKDAAGLTLAGAGMERTLNIRELKALAAEEIFGVIETPYIKINSKTVSCVKGVFAYIEHGGKATSIYRQSPGMRTVPAVSASFINIIEDGKMRKIRLKGTLTIPELKIPSEYQKFI